MSASQIESIGNRLESRRTLKLSNSDTIKFLQLYRDEKLLYDIRIPQYSNRNLRREATKRIANAINIPGFGTRQVKEKFKNLRNAYSQEIKKIEVSNTNVVSCAENVYVPKVHWFSTMHSFLRPFIYHRFAVSITVTVSTNIYLKILCWNIFKCNNMLLLLFSTILNSCQCFEPSTLYCTTSSTLQKC